MNKQIKNALDKLFKVIPYTPTPENELAIVGILQGLQNKPVLNLQKLVEHDNTQVHCHLGSLEIRELSIPPTH